MDIIQEQRISPFWRTKYGALVAGFGVLLAIGASLVAWAFGPVAFNAHTTREFTVQTGWGTSRIAQELEAGGLIRSNIAFVLYARASGIGDRMQAGRYLVYSDMSVAQIARLIASGAAISDDLWVTIPEGMNIWEVDRLLTAAGIILPGQLRRDFSYKEGHLFPETYRFAKDATAQDVVSKMESTYFERGGTRSDIDLIVASMLEKEAKTPEDMAMVAGIIHKRMDIGMALQIDATVGYGWCVRVRGFSRDCDVAQAPIATEIKVDGAYNTYARTGLPVGAISNPGLKALEAAAHPKKSDYLYYLSTRDGSQLIYSKTLQEHLQNRQKYLGF